jgi:ribulose-5-phosphate 4-epimerase/fuculose-1-phosphate aldolase
MKASVMMHFSDRQPETEQALRVDLAAAFRWTYRFDWHEAVANHFSVATSADGRDFLMNPRWKHFSRIKASDLVLYNSDDESVLDGPDAPDPTAWCIHGSIHKMLPQARVVLHVHPPYATALAALSDPELKPIDQVTARFYNRVAIDLNFQGLADDRAEGERLAAALGNKRCMIMGNHGVLVIGQTIAEAFDDLYFLERAARTMILAKSTGEKLNILPPDIAEKTAAGWESYQEMSFAHFAELKEILNENEPSYAS